MRSLLRLAAAAATCAVLAPAAAQESDPLSAQALQRLAGRLGSQFTWETEWEAAAKRAAAEKKLVLVEVVNQSGFQVRNRIRTSILLDPDVAAMVRRRFVLLQFRQGMRAPWVTIGGGFGISARAFGTTMLIVDDRGTYIDDLQAVTPVLVDRFLREILAEHPEATGAVIDHASPDGASNAQAHLERGELEAAAKLVNDDDRPAARRVRAHIARRTFDGRSALDELTAARAAAAPALLPDLDVDTAHVHLRMGNWREAGELGIALFKRRPRHPRIPEALYYVGYAQLRLGGVTAAQATWRRLVQDHPGSPWAWKAAEILTSPYIKAGTAERVQWPSPAVREVLERALREGPEHTESTERDAVRYLLNVQRDDGSWVSPTESTSPLTSHFSDFTIAKTSLCATSLLAYRAGPTVARAIDRALNFLSTYRELKANAKPAPRMFMDYSPWARAYELAFYVEASVAGVGDKTTLAGLIGAAIADLQATQKPGGGWSYYVSTAADQSEAQNQSISFLTAACTHALLDARSMGAEIPPGVLERAIACLERMRNPTGHFEYFLWHDQEPRPPVTTLDLGALGRGPICMLALHRAGKASVGDVQRSLDLLLEHRALYHNERGKSLMHAGPHGQGCHYLLFDYLYAARCQRRLPSEAQPPYRLAIARLIHANRYRNGGYEDTPLGGRHAGTGLALLGIRALVPKRR